MLTPLADALGVSVGELLAGERIGQEQVREKTDRVILGTMKLRSRIQPWQWTVLAVGILALCLALILTFGPGGEPSGFEIVTRQSLGRFRFGKPDTHMLMPGDGLARREQETGYEYYSTDGKERYLYKVIPGRGEEPILAFLSCFGEGKLFGISIGEPTVREAVPELGAAGYALLDYLEEQGFSWKYDPLYRESNLVYLAGERCYWYCYEKDGVFINILISHVDSTLKGYEVGFLEENLLTLLRSDESEAYRGLWDTAEKLSGDNFNFLQIPAGDYKWFVFIPPETGSYRFHCETKAGTVGELFPAIAGWHSTEGRLTWDDNGGKNGRDFLLEYGLKEGEPIYLRVRGDDWAEVELSFLWVEKIL